MATNFKVVSFTVLRGKINEVSVNGEPELPQPKNRAYSAVYTSTRTSAGHNNHQDEGRIPSYRDSQTQRTG